MSTIAHTPRAARLSKGQLGMLFTALGTLLAVAVAVVLLTLPGSSSTTPTTASSVHGASAAYAPLIQYRGTGAVPASASDQTAPVGQSGMGYLHQMRGLPPVQ